MLATIWRNILVVLTSGVGVMSLSDSVPGPGAVSLPDLGPSHGTTSLPDALPVRDTDY